jgi:hypothetical protein
MVAKDHSWFGEGHWSVHGNKVCGSVKWTAVKTGKTGKGKPDCWTWYKAGDRYLDLWSGEKDNKDGWYDGELKRLREGDRISAKVAELKAQVKK